MLFLFPDLVAVVDHAAHSVGERRNLHVGKSNPAPQVFTQQQGADEQVDNQSVVENPGRIIAPNGKPHTACNIGGKENRPQNGQFSAVSGNAGRECVAEIQTCKLLDQWSGFQALYEDIKQDHPTIGFATVYRTLKLFKESGIASERNFGDGKARYEPIRSEAEHHHHMICTECGQIVEFANMQIESCLLQVARLNEFNVSNHKLEIYGLCSDCKK